MYMLGANDLSVWIFPLELSAFLGCMFVRMWTMSFDGKCLQHGYIIESIWLQWMRTRDNSVSIPLDTLFRVLILLVFTLPPQQLISSSFFLMLSLSHTHNIIIHIYGHRILTHPLDYSQQFWQYNVAFQNGPNCKYYYVIDILTMLIRANKSQLALVWWMVKCRLHFTLVCGIFGLRLLVVHRRLRRGISVSNAILLGLLRTQQKYWWNNVTHFIIHA